MRSKSGGPDRGRDGRFLPGHSGNREGRPRKEAAAQAGPSMIEGFASEKHAIKVNGAVVTLTTLEIVLQFIRDGYARGDIKAGRVYDELMDGLMPTHAGGRTAFLIVPEVRTPVEFEEEMRLHRMKLGQEAADDGDTPGSKEEDPLPKH